MIRYIFCFCLAAVCSSAHSQIIAEESVNGDAPVMGSLVDGDNSAVKYGYCSSEVLLKEQPEYALAMQQLKKLREQYEAEAQYNESDFRRQFSEYLSGQKDFPQSILLKRQRDLQELMEKSVAFRAEADSLLQKAEEDLLAPIKWRIESAIHEVAVERGYDYVVDKASGAYLYLNPALSEDITAFVEEKLQAKK